MDKEKKAKIAEIEAEIKVMEDRIEFLKTDKTVISLGSDWNHGPYYRKLETKNLKAKIKRRNRKMNNLIYG